MGYGVFPEIDAAAIHDLLHLKGHKHSKAFGGKRSESVDPSHADGQRGVQPVKLLKFQRCHLTHMLARGGKDSVRIRVKLLLAVRSDNHCNDRKHHALVAGGQVVQKLLAFLALKLHVIRHDSGKVVALILAALPVRDVRLHAEQTVFHLAHRLVGGDRDDVDGEHHVSVEVCQLGHHAVLDIRSVVFEEKHAPVFLAQLEIVAVLFHAVRADIVAEVVSLFHHVPRVKVKVHFFTGAVEVVQNAQPFRCVHGCAFGAERGEVGDEVCADTGEIGAGFLNILFCCGNCDILLLHNAIRAGRLIQQHLVVFLAVLVQSVPAQGHKDGILKIRLVHSAVVDSDFSDSSAVKAVQEFGVGQKHTLLILARRHLIVDVRKAEGLRKLIPDLENPVRPDTAYGDHILHLAGNAVLFLVLLDADFQRFNHWLSFPPLRGFRWYP